MRERVGLSEASNFAKYRVSGDGAARSGCRGCSPTALPKIGRTNLTAMLNPQGRIVGEFSVSRVGADDFFLFGSQAAEVHHPRWFIDHLPAKHSERLDPLRGARPVDGRASPSPGRGARDVLQKLTDTSLATADFPFMAFREVDIGHGAGVAVAHDVHR